MEAILGRVSGAVLEDLGSKMVFLIILGDAWKSKIGEQERKMWQLREKVHFLVRGSVDGRVVRVQSKESWSPP